VSSIPNILNYCVILIKYYIIYNYKCGRELHNATRRAKDCTACSDLTVDSYTFRVSVSVWTELYWPFFSALSQIPQGECQYYSWTASFRILSTNPSTFYVVSGTKSVAVQSSNYGRRGVVTVTLTKFTFLRSVKSDRYWLTCIPEDFRAFPWTVSKYLQRRKASNLRRH
jgi:hypothetical protein